MAKQSKKQTKSTLTVKLQTPNKTYTHELTNLPEEITKTLEQTLDSFLQTLGLEEATRYTFKVAKTKKGT